MLISHIILALSASFAPLVLGRPADLQDHVMPAASAEPASLLGRHYSVQDRRQDLSPDLLAATRPDVSSANAARRLVPYAKFLADRSDEPWLRMRERRADNTGGDVNYLSNVSTYSAPKPFAPPSPPAPVPPPSVTVRPPPTVASPNIPSAATTRAVSTKSKSGKDTQKKHTSKTKMTKASKEKVRKAENHARAD